MNSARERVETGFPVYNQYMGQLRPILIIGKLVRKYRRLSICTGQLNLKSGYVVEVDKQTYWAKELSRFVRLSGREVFTVSGQRELK